MAVTVTSLQKSVPLVAWYYDVEGLVAGVNAIALPAPTLQGAFPPDGLWTPSEIWCFPYDTGVEGSLVTPDLSSITQVNGQVNFNVYATAATNCRILVW